MLNATAIELALLTGRQEAERSPLPATSAYRDIVRRMELIDEAARYADAAHIASVDSELWPVGIAAVADLLATLFHSHKPVNSDTLREMVKNAFIKT